MSKLTVSPRFFAARHASSHTCAADRESAGVMPDQVRFVAVGQNSETQASAFKSGTVIATYWVVVSRAAKNTPVNTM